MQKQLLAEMVLFISLRTLPSLQRRLQSTTDSSIKMQLSHGTAMSVLRHLCLMDKTQGWEVGNWAPCRAQGPQISGDLSRIQFSCLQNTTNNFHLLNNLTPTLAALLLPRRKGSCGKLTQPKPAGAGACPPS